MDLLKAEVGQPGFVKPKMCIISAYPEGLVPYERSELSKDCLKPSNLHLRDWQVRENPPEKEKNAPGSSLSIGGRAIQGAKRGSTGI